MFAAMAWYVRDLVMGRCDRAHPLKDSRGSEWFDADFSYMFEKLKVMRMLSNSKAATQSA